MSLKIVGTSIRVFMALYITVVLTLIGISVYLVDNLTKRLVYEARDAVWEASVPAEYVYMTISNRINIHQTVASEITRDSDNKNLRSSKNIDNTSWDQLMKLSVDFPSDIRTSIAQTNESLVAFDAAKERTKELIILGQAEQARNNLLGMQTVALESFSDQASRLLQKMASRISEVNSKMERTAHMTLSWLVSISISILVLIGGMTFLLQVGITASIQRINEFMINISAGNYNTDAPKTGWLFELAQMSATVRVFRVNLIEREKLRREQDEQRNAAEANRRDLLHHLAVSFESKVGGIVGSVIEAARGLHAAAARMSLETASAAKQAEAVAVAAQDANVNVRNVAHASGSLSISMQDVGSQIRASRERIRHTVEQAGKANIDIKSLDTAAISIGNVAEVISSFAEQTNLLSLNATIEAARAGHAGTGFGVVAQEVKSLALKTAGASSEIAGRIGAIQIASSATVSSIHAMSESINELAVIANYAGGTVAKQIEMTSLIAANVNEAAQKTESVMNSIGEASSAIIAASDLVNKVVDAALELSRNGEKLSLETQYFAETIRAS